MDPNSNSAKSLNSKCSVCSMQCKYFYYRVKCCEACKHFFRRSIMLMKEYNCKNGKECDIEKVTIKAKCKRCRLNKCLAVGMDPRGVGITGKQIKQQLATATTSSSSSFSASSAEIGKEFSALATASSSGPPKKDSLKSTMVQKDLLGFITLKHLLEIEHKARQLRYSQKQIPEFFYEQCNSFEAIFARKANLLESANKFSIKPTGPPAAIILEKMYRVGPFGNMPSLMTLDLLSVFEIGKTLPFFGRLDTNDKIALCSNIAMALYVLSNCFYSVQQNCDVICTPSGVIPMNVFANSYYNKDPIAMEMGNKLLCKVVQPFSRLKLCTEEFVLVRAIIYSHMVSPGLSDYAQKLLLNEAEKFSALLMSVLQINYGPAAAALRYVELMGLIDFVFNMGAKHRQLLTYISNVLDPNFDRVMPPVLAKICTKGPVESHQLFPY
ncbi:hypothetical protein niasHT_034044 [Heterodera trifolii]|uniref:Uncharacterized protein n=1 Tax=Heterodera trifolii TaxID=157864 RepID=A0ABD2IEC0_9BILA